MSIPKISTFKNKPFAETLLKQYQTDAIFKQLIENMKADNFDFDRLPAFENILLKYFRSQSLCQDKTQDCQQENKGFRFFLKHSNSHLFLILKECNHENDLNIFGKNCLIADFPQHYLTTKLKSQVKDLLNKERNTLISFQKQLLNNGETTKKWLVLTGNFGTGKTFLTVFFAQTFALKNKGKIIFVDANNLATRFLEKRSDTDFKFFFEKLKTIDLLIIDDFGSENRFLQFRDEFLLPIFKTRFNLALPTVVISNFTYLDLKKTYSFSNDKTEQIKIETFFGLFQKAARFLTLTKVFKG